jgi:hypothetical protein
VHDSTTEFFLAEELKKLVGWGAAPKRVAVMPNLRRLAGVEGGTSLITAGKIIRKFIETAIQSIGPAEFEGRQRDAHDLKRVFRLLLQFEGVSKSAENRRYTVIAKLGIPCTVDAWRRPDGPELDLMEILAKAMTARQT